MPDMKGICIKDYDECQVWFVKLIKINNKDW